MGVSGALVLAGAFAVVLGALSAGVSGSPRVGLAAQSVGMVLLGVGGAWVLFSGHVVGAGFRSDVHPALGLDGLSGFFVLVVAVVGEIANKMVDAAAMAKGLGDKGHIALYGIYFDTDKAAIKPESRPTLDEIAKLLNGQPTLSVFIVGHTDSQGSFEHNMTLSRQRAEAVAAALVAP